MKHLATLAFVGLAAVSLAGCSTTERGAAFGATAGAIAGGVTTGTVTGAAIGAGIGAAAGGLTGALIAHAKGTENTCIYENPDGSRYRADCPAGVRWN